MTDDMSQIETLEARITELEIRLSHHEKASEDLSDVIAEQQRLIDRLVIEYRRPLERMETNARWGAMLTAPLPEPPGPAAADPDTPRE